MDSSALQSVEENMPHSIHHKDNGTYPNQSEILGADLSPLSASAYNNNNNNNNSHVNGVEVVVQPVNLSPAAQSASTKKGYGLKKWRRIKRASSKKDIAAAAAAEDYSKVLKRGLPGSSTPITPLPSSSAEIKQNTVDSGGPSNVFKNVAAVESGFTPSGSSLDSRFAVGAAATDSDNSQDWSSKSSTAASAPKVSRGLPSVLGYPQENNRMKNLLAKNLGNSNQPGKTIAESTKKHRGERIKIDKENSHSSMESDSKSSNFVFVQGVSSATSNGKQRGRSVNYNGDNSNEAYTSEQQFSEEVQTAYRSENVTENEELSQDSLTTDLMWKAKKGKSENHRGLPVHDPLVESILALQSVQDALEKEVHKLGEIGREPVFLPVNSGDNTSAAVDSNFTEICEPSSSDQLASEKIGEHASITLENQLLTLKRKVKSLESSLEEAKVVLELKNTRIVELEATTNSSKSPKEESGSTAELQLEKLIEMELEFEGLFQQKLEAEIEYLALMRVVEKLRVAAIDQKKLLVGEEVHILKQLEDAENKDAELKRQAEKLEKYCGDILGAEEILKMQRRVCKVTFCFFIQLMLLVLVFWLVVLQLNPLSGVVVPT